MTSARGILPWKMNASLGCYGCREATDMTEGEAVLGLPVKGLGTIFTSLGKVRAKAMLRVRSKAVCNALMEIEGRSSVWEDALRTT